MEVKPRRKRQRPSGKSETEKEMPELEDREELLLKPGEDSAGHTGLG